MNRLNPYLHFQGQAREALQFYASALGGEPTMSTFADFGMPGVSESDQNLIMHGQLITPGGMWLMVSDSPAAMPLTRGDNVTLSLSGDDEAALRGFWNGLAEGATIEMDLAPAPWGDTFGQLIDRFGISWMVNIVGQPPAS